jgi:AraC-like DNA-binding protein
MEADSMRNIADAAPRPPSEVALYGALFAAAAAAFCLAQTAGPRLGLAAGVVAVAGDATCGWSWLLVRALFQPPRARRALWPLALVLLLVATGAFLRAFDGPSALPRMIGNLSALVSSALLLLAAIEPLKGLEARTPRAERLFRIGFSAGYCAVLAVAVIWVDGAPPGSWADTHRAPVKAACAALAAAGMGYAVWRRRRHPLPAARRASGSGDADLGQRVLRLMADEAVFTQTNLKVSDLARRLGEAEYKVTQSITGPLGFSNFNQMANGFRVEEAKRRLSDRAFDALPILTIAYDCGFGSVGPFNRAFKARTGMTPMAFRDARRGA